MFREKEIGVYTQIFVVSKAISQKILKKLLTVVAFTKGDSVTKTCGMKGDFIPTVYSCSFSMLYHMKKIPMQYRK